MLLEELSKLTGESVIETQDSESGDESHTTDSLTEPASKHANREAEATEL